MVSERRGRRSLPKYMEREVRYLLQYSVPGKLYAYWLNSRVFAAICAFCLPFSRAAEHSVVLRALGRDSRLERMYAGSLIAKLLKLIFDIIIYVPKRILGVFTPYATSSTIVRSVQGSAIMKLPFMLGAFAFLMFVMPHSLWSNSYALLGTVGLFGLYLLSVSLNAREIVYPSQLGLPFLLFVMSCLISLLFTRSFSDSFRVLLFFASAFLLHYLMRAIITDVKSLRTVLGFLYLALIVTAFYACIQAIIGVEIDVTLTDIENNVGVPGRVYSTLDNPNNFAEYIIIFTPLAAAFAMNVKRPFLRLCACSLLVLPLLAMVLTYSRAAWFALLLAAVVFIFFANKKILPIFFLAALLAIPFLPESVVVRILSIFYGNDTSMAHRLYLWQGIEMLLKDNFHWLTGIGMGPETFAEVYPSYVRYGAEEGVFHSQMQYLEVILELGLLGGISFIWMLCRDIKDSTLTYYRESEPLVKLAAAASCASLIGLLLSFAVEYVWYYPRILFAFFILTGILSAVVSISKAKSKKENVL